MESHCCLVARLDQSTDQGLDGSVTLTVKRFQDIMTWANGLIAIVRPLGRSLSSVERKIAKDVGVVDTNSIRVFETDELPLLPSYDIIEICLKADFNLNNFAGLTLDHTIIIKKGSYSTDLIAHELRHVFQVEDLGSFQSMIIEYAEQVIKYGYYNAPLEKDARQFG